MMVKICGVTNLEDALAASEGGARALGFNFYPRSPRYIDWESAARWISSVPAGVWKVGVFVNEPPDKVSALARCLGLDVVQLHGDETPADYPQGLRVWKAARVGGAFRISDIDQDPAEAVLLDSPANGGYGGSGKTFDWSVAAGSTKKIIIAGGLDAGNVRQAIEQAKPWGVDACSGIECVPGRKDHGKMARFLKAALAETSS